MIWGIIYVLALGVVWANLLTFLLFSSGFIYNYITKKGKVRKKFKTGSKRWLAVAAVGSLAYMTLGDRIILGNNEYPFLMVMLLNIFLVAVLLAYNVFVINSWLLVVVRPTFLKIPKMMTSVTIQAYSRFIWIYGGAAGFIIAMISANLYLYSNYLAR